MSSVACIFSLCLCFLHERSPLENDYEFISKEYISIGMTPFGLAQSKAMRAYAQSKQYHTIMKSRDF